MAEDWVRLNVGGTIFLTTQSTLRNEDSFLSHLLGGADENSFRAAPTDADGCVRVDRSPAVFDLVLDYLRNLENFVAPIFPSRDFTLLEREAKFFGLEGLSQALALVRAETDAARNSLSSSARVMRSFVNNGGDRLVHLSGLPDVVSDQHIFLAMERLSLRSLSSEPVIPFPQPSFLRTLRDPLRPVAPGSGFMCKGSAILAYNCVAHAARAIAAVNSGAMPIIDGNPLSGVTLFAAWADEPSVPPFAFEEASIMSIEIGPTPQVMHARPIPPIDHPFHQQQVPAAAGAAGNEDPMQAILAASLAAARGQAQVLAQVQAQAQVVQAQAQVVQAHAAQAAQAVQAQAQAQAEAQAQVAVPANIGAVNAATTAGLQNTSRVLAPPGNVGAASSGGEAAPPPDRAGGAAAAAPLAPIAVSLAPVTLPLAPVAFQLAVAGGGGGGR